MLTEGVCSIGQRNHFSDNDIRKINTLYEVSKIQNEKKKLYIWKVDTSSVHNKNISPWSKQSNSISPKTCTYISSVHRVSTNRKHHHHPAYYHYSSGKRAYNVWLYTNNVKAFLVIHNKIKQNIDLDQNIGSLTDKLCVLLIFFCFLCLNIICFSLVLKATGTVPIGPPWASAQQLTSIM